MNASEADIFAIFQKIMAKKQGFLTQLRHKRVVRTQF